jgi:protein-S-isoprenylcysteine O-methyltransferase Ste14
MTPSLYTQLAYYAWCLLFIVWIVGYFTTKRTAQIPKWGEQIVVLILLALSISFLLRPQGFEGAWGMRLYNSVPVVGWLGVALAVIGVAFAIWARVSLGSNWSGAVVVTVKKDHELVEHGPYAYVRHPIYSGFLMAGLGTALTLATPVAFAGVASMLVAFLIRPRREEQMMTAAFPAAYEQYKKRTKALVPFLL